MKGTEPNGGKWGGVKNFVWRVLREMDSQWWIGGFRVFWDNNHKFYFTTIISLTIYMQNERCCITYNCSLMLLAYSILLIVFSIVLYFINSSSKRKRLEKLTQESIKIFKIGYFVSVLSWIKRRKYRFKIWFEEGELQKYFDGGGFDVY